MRLQSRGFPLKFAFVQKPASETLFVFPAIIALFSIVFYIVFFLPPASPLFSARSPLRIIQAATCLLAW